MVKKNFFSYKNLKIFEFEEIYYAIKIRLFIKLIRKIVNRGLYYYDSFRQNYFHEWLISGSNFHDTHITYDLY